MGLSSRLITNSNMELFKKNLLKYEVSYSWSSANYLSLSKNEVGSVYCFEEIRRASRLIIEIPIRSLQVYYNFFFPILVDA